MNMGSHDLRTITEGSKRIRFMRLLFSDNSPFREVASTTFSEVCLVQMYWSTEVAVSRNRITLGPELFGSALVKPGLAEQVLKTCAESTKTISFGMNMPRELYRETEGNRFIEQFTSLILQYCSNVENLEFASPSPGDGVAPTLFTKFSSQLRSVKCNVWKQDDSFLIGDLSICPGIRQLTAPCTPQLMTLLKVIGSSLESLTVKYSKPERCAEALDVIQENCRNLTKLVLTDSKDFIGAVGGERYAELLCSYDEQLVSAETDGLPIWDLREVGTKCPNLKVEYLMVKHNGLAWKRVDIFGPRINHLMIDMKALRDEESEAALQKCTNLAELTSFNFDGLRQDHRVLNDAIMALLTPLSRDTLERLHLLQFIASHQIINKIVTTTSKLKSLWILPEGPIQDVNVFRTVVDMNPHLHSIHIEEDISYDEGRDAVSAVNLLRSLLDVFSKCDSMFFGILNTSVRNVSTETIHNVCGAVACRGVEIEVRIGSTKYTQPGRLKAEL